MEDLHLDLEVSGFDDFVLPLPEVSDDSPRLKQPANPQPRSRKQNASPDLKTETLILQNLKTAGIVEVLEEPDVFHVTPLFCTPGETGAPTINWKNVSIALQEIDPNVKANRRKGLTPYRRMLQAALRLATPTPGIASNSAMDVARENIATMNALRMSIDALKESIVLLTQRQQEVLETLSSSSAKKRQRDEPAPPQPRPPPPREPSVTERLTEALRLFLRTPGNDNVQRQAEQLIYAEMSSKLTFAQPHVTDPARLGWRQTNTVEIPLTLVTQAPLHARLLPFLHQAAADARKLLQEQSFPLAFFKVQLQPPASATVPSLSLLCVFARQQAT